MSDAFKDESYLSVLVRVRFEFKQGEFRLEVWILLLSVKKDEV